MNEGDLKESTQAVHGKATTHAAQELADTSELVLLRPVVVPSIVLRSGLAHAVFSLVEIELVVLVVSLATVTTFMCLIFMSECLCAQEASYSEQSVHLFFSIY